MKSKEFIIEDKLADLAFELEKKYAMTGADIYELLKIKQKCQPFLQQAHNLFMWRGVRQTLPDPFIHKAIRLDDRKPKDTPRRLHNKFNEYFEARFGAPFRNSMFTAGKPGMVSDYGRIYAVFPEGDFKFIWNPEVPDLYGKWQDTYEPRQTSNMPKEEWNDILTRAEDKFMDKWVHSKYQNTDLEAALRSGNEIMIRATGYHGINRDLIEQYPEAIMEILNEK